MSIITILTSPSHRVGVIAILCFSRSTQPSFYDYFDFNGEAVDEALSATTLPFLSNLGADAFRSGEVGVAIVGGQTLYNFEIPFASPLTSSSIVLALSMVNYDQNISIAGNNIFYNLYEDTPSSSNNTHGVFAVELGLVIDTAVAKVKYLACTFSTLSPDFYILVSQFVPGGGSLGVCCFGSAYYHNHFLAPTLNVGSVYSTVSWFSGLNVHRVNPSLHWFYLEIQFFTGPNKIEIINKTPSNAITFFGQGVRVTFIFLGDIATRISVTYKLPYSMVFFSYSGFPFSLNNYNTWLDFTHIICGQYEIQLKATFYRYTTSIIGDSVTFSPTVIGAYSPWVKYNCIIAGGKMCPATYPYYDSTTGLCQDSCPGQIANYVCCPPSCDICLTSAACTFCSSGYYLRPDNLCYSGCPNGTLPNSLTRTCELCPSNCDVCVSTTACWTCSPGFYLRPDYLCYTSCLTGTLVNNGSRTCDPCPPNCDSCSSTSACSTCSSGYYLRSDNLCYSTCLIATVPNSGSRTCDPCPPNCDNCSSSSVCSACSSGFFLRADNLCYSTCLNGTSASNGSSICCATGCLVCSSPTVCQTCSSCFELNPNHVCVCLLGQAVTGGCTKVEGCQEVLYISYPPLNLGKCITCTSSLVLTNGSCSCGYSGQVLVDGACYPKVAGCISYQMTSGLPRCLFCSLTGNFEMNPSTNLCSCNEEYVLEGESCKEKCGDGVIKEAECDDGNTQNGDGCSNSCQIQIYFRCSASSSPSSCTFVKRGIQASLVKIERVGKEDQARFTFIFTPNPFTFYTFAKANHLFSLMLEDSTQINVTWSYSNGYIIAIGPFTVDMEGKNGIANFTFDQQYIKSDPIFLNFTIESRTIQLETLKDSSKVVTFNTVMLAISCMSLGLLLVGSLLHKMVGVEFLHCIQLIYYLHFTFSKYSITISSLQSLSLVAFNNLFWQTENQNMQTEEQYQKVDFSVDYTDLTVVFLAIPALMTILGSILYKVMTSRCSDGQSEPGCQLIVTIRKKLYHAFIFPFTLGFLTPFLLAHFSLCMATSPFSFNPHQAISLFSLIIAAITSVVLSIQYLHVPFKSLKEEFQLAKKMYIPIYCFYWIVMTLLLWLWIRLGYSFCLYPMLMMVVLMILFMLFYRPYRGKMDTIGSICNFMLQLLFLLTTKLRNINIFPSSYNADMILCLAISVFCSVCFILSVVRVILAFRCRDQKIATFVEQTKIRSKKGMRKRKTSKKLIEKRITQSFSIMKEQPVKESLIDHNFRFRQQEMKKEKEVDEQLLKLIAQKKKTFKRKPKLLEEGPF